MPMIDPKIWAGRNKGQIDTKLNFSFPVSCTKAKEEDGELYVEFVASDTDIDLHTERFTENAIKSMVGYSKKGVELTKTHFDAFGMGITVDGEMISDGVDKVSKIDIYKFKGLAKLDKRYPESLILFEDIKSGKNTRQLSVGGFIDWEEEDAVLWEEYEIPVTENKSMTLYVLAINKFYLEHIAITRHNGAANPRTGFTTAIARSIDDDWMRKNDIVPSYENINEAIKTGQSKFKYNLGWLNLGHSQISTHKSLVGKTANGHPSFPLADEKTKWSFTTDDANDILGDSDEKDWSTYKKVHFWYDPENKENKAGYKLPFAKKIDDTIKAVWKGCAAAMAALLGARGGVDIPDDQRKSVYGKISNYYIKFGKEVPEFKSYTYDEFVSLSAHADIADFIGKYKFYFQEETMSDELKKTIVDSVSQESEDRMKAMPGDHLVAKSETPENPEQEIETTEPATENQEENVSNAETTVESEPAQETTQETEVLPDTPTENKSLNPEQSVPDLKSIVEEAISSALKSVVSENAEIKTMIDGVVKRLEKVEVKETPLTNDSKQVSKTVEKPDRLSDCMFGKI